MRRFHTAVVGGGASGLFAAISAKQAGHDVVICERLPAIARKLLACGGGRCNFLNEKLDPSCYNLPARELVGSVFSRFGYREILEFFERLGVHYYSEDGRLFPVTNQSATIVRALELEIRKLSIPLELGFAVVDIADKDGLFQLTSSSNKKVVCDRLVMAAGGRSYPGLGSDGSCYRFCRGFGHRVVKPVPCCVALETAGKERHLLDGQKIFVCAKSLIDGKMGSESSGELLFTKYGLSGTAILDISRDISLALNSEPARDAAVSIDLVPFMEQGRLREELTKRIGSGSLPEDLLCGILPGRFGKALIALLSSGDPEKISRELKNRLFKVLRTRGWNEAEFTCGGVDTAEVDPKSLRSLLKDKLYFCGELLDVDGIRGGYNLAWAFSSGFIAGLTE